MKRRLIVSLAVLLAAACVLVCSCEHGDGREAPGAGRLVRAEWLGTLTPDVVATLISVSGLDLELRLDYTVEIYRLIYLTTDTAGGAVEASAALYVPMEAPAAPMAGVQHATETRRDHVASEAPALYGFDALVLAAEGYVACAADYLGFGVSASPHPYLHADTSAGTVVDAVRASEQWCRAEGVALNGQLFLAGYSQGAFVTVAAQRAVEAAEQFPLTLTAVAALSGPYDLPGIVAQLLDEPERTEPLFAAYVLTTYNRVYGWNRLPDMLLAPYAQRVMWLFGGDYTVAEVSGWLPPTVSALLDPDFMDRYRRGGEPEVRGAMVENSLIDWAPRAPLRLYHGTADTIVPYENAVSAQASFLARGATDVDLILLEGEGHESAILNSLESVLAWFRGLRE